MPEESVKLDLNDLNVLTDKVTVADPTKKTELDDVVKRALSDANLAPGGPVAMPTVTIKW